MEGTRTILMPSSILNLQSSANSPPPAQNLRLSIVIPTNKRSDLLRLCLKSIFLYARQETEIIVVHDGSPQGCADSVIREFPGIQWLRSDRPRGFCVAVNAGIRVARGAVVEVLNDDTEVTEGWAKCALAWFDDPAVAAVAPLVLKKKGSGPFCRNGPKNTSHQRVLTPFSSSPVNPEIDSAGDRYYLGGVAGKRGHGQPLGPDYLQPCRVFGASASSAFYRRDVLLQLGAFPESFGAYFEDVDLAFRLNRAGYRIMFEPRSRVFHRGGGSYGVPRRKLLEQQSRNEERVFWRNIPTAAWRQAVPRHVAVLAGKAWRRWQEGRLIPFLCGRLRLLGEIGTLTQHRRWLDQIALATDPANWSVESGYWG
jgi:GT2 family glycosyltransferase